MAVTALEIHSRVLVLDGRPFGKVGAYEKLAGIIRSGALAPSMVSRRAARGRRAGGWGDAAAARGEKEPLFFLSVYALLPISNRCATLV
jgi:hypothetical protein